VLLVWGEDYRAWMFPTGHLMAGESLPQAALRAACAAGVDAWLTRPTPPQPAPGLTPVDSPWRTYTLAAPPSGTGSPPGGAEPDLPARPWHLHLDHLFICVADSRARIDPAAWLRNQWAPLHALPDLVRPDIPALARAAIRHATAAVYRPYQRINRQPGHQHCPQDHRGRTHR